MADIPALSLKNFNSFENNAQITESNPMGTDGFEFVEYSSPDPQSVHQLFTNMGFTLIARHRSKDVQLYRQGEINFILNNEPNTQGEKHARDHGPGACAMAFRVADASYAHRRALTLGAQDFQSPKGPGEFNIPAIQGIGDTVLYFVDKYEGATIYDEDFIPLPGVDQNPVGAGLKVIDHLTHNVYHGRMDHWANFYEKLFNFYELHFFNITGKKTGLISRAMSAPCGKIRIPINESDDPKSQINEYLDQYKGEGIQHVALTTDNIVHSVAMLQDQGIPFMTVPATYYEVIEERLPGHGLEINALRKHHILIDGEVDQGKKDLLLQLFTNTVIGPIFFEIIQRKGHKGFGEGNFTALFEAIERDQMARGTL